MIAEVLLLLAGHQSSLFPSDHTLHPAFAPLLHPGEQQCLESLGLIAYRYRQIQDASERLARSPSRYISALCATLRHILADEYESLVVTTEARVLRRDSGLVASGSFVPLSSIRATFAEWDAPLAALQALVAQLEAQPHWNPGPLIDLLLSRSRTGVHKVASILSRLCNAVQVVWRTQLIAFLVHGSLPAVDPLASKDYVLLEGSMPHCVSAQSRDSVAYIGRAIGTVKAAKWQKQLPRSLAADYTKMLERVIPEDQHGFDRVIADIRTSVGEWLWLNVLTQKDVEDAVDSLANYFLLRDGEFGLSFIREIEQLKISRLTARVGPNTMIREQDLQLALLRASLGTSAQHDPSLSHLRCQLPSGPIRPLLPSLSNVADLKAAAGPNTTTSQEATTFDDLLLGTRLSLTYSVTWPLDLFLQPSDLQIYGALFAYLSSLRKTHTRVHICWASLSNAQRARRRWTGLGEGGTAEDVVVRRELLRCGWGVVREMSWFLDTLLGYVMTDVVDVEFRRLKTLLAQPATEPGSGTGIGARRPSQSQSDAALSASQTSAGGAKPHLDFTTLQTIHATYLERLLASSLLGNPSLTAIVRPILEVCERFVAQVERWGGDVLPALLFEGSLGEEDVGSMVKDRWTVVAEINETLHALLQAFYEQLSQSTSQQAFVGPDVTKSAVFGASGANVTAGMHTTFSRIRAGTKGSEADGEVRRHVERLLLRLDFNGGFSKPAVHADQGAAAGGEQILKEGGLA